MHLNVFRNNDFVYFLISYGCLDFFFLYTPISANLKSRVRSNLGAPIKMGFVESLLHFLTSSRVLSISTKLQYKNEGDLLIILRVLMTWEQ